MFSAPASYKAIPAEQVFAAIKSSKFDLSKIERDTSNNSKGARKPFTAKSR
jgi:hypothetical protein